MKNHATYIARIILAVFALWTSAASAASVGSGDSSNGANLTGEFTSTLSKTQYTAGLSGKAEARVFGKALNLAGGDAKLTVTKGSGTSRVQVNLKAIGKTLVSLDKNITNTGSFRTANFYTAETGGKMSFGLGPFNFKLEGKAEMQAYCDGNMNIAWAANHPPVVEAAFGPVLDAAASAKFEVNAVIASAGIDGSLKLAGYGVRANVKLTPRTGSGQNQADVAYAATFDRQATQGSVKIWGKIGVGFLSVKKDKTIFSYAGGPSSAVLASGTLRIN